MRILKSKAIIDSSKDYQCWNCTVVLRPLLRDWNIKLVDHEQHVFLPCPTCGVDLVVTDCARRAELLKALAK